MRCHFKAFLTLALFYPSFSDADFYGTKPQGFLWYNAKSCLTRKEVPKETKIKAQEETPASRNLALKAKLEDAIQALLDQPTIKNARKAQLLQKEVIERGESVAKAWLLASLLEEDIITPQTNPNVLHRALYKKDNRKAFQETLTSMKENWGLIVQVM